MQELIVQTVESIRQNNLLSALEVERAKVIFETGDHVILSYGLKSIKVQLQNEGEEMTVEILTNEHEDALFLKTKGAYTEWSSDGLAALFLVQHEFKDELFSEGKKYTRDGMIKRVWEERLDKAKKANYKVQLADNLFGEHTLIDEKGRSYQVTLKDFDKKTGYIDNIDWKTNKLGTTKHILFLFQYLEAHPRKKARLEKHYPFVEIFTDPRNEYKISWYFPEALLSDEQALLSEYFENNTYIEDAKIPSFFSFFQKSKDFGRIKIREEVYEKIEAYFEKVELAQLEKQNTLDFSIINATLYPYQKEGIAFSVFKKGVIIADEMGLGKTLQAITTAILKKEIFNFKKTLVVCPASVKHQWKNEILKFSKEKAVVIEGNPQERHEMYTKNTVVILDEAQKIKNYETKTAVAIKGVQKKHGLVITGTPLENKLLDLYSIVQFVDQKLLAPQWEFSYKHCIFDTQYKNKIHGYYNLQNLKKCLQSILIRREKSEVFEQLPTIVQKNIYVNLSDEQAAMHIGFSKGIAKILGKKFKTSYDWQKLMLLLTKMRMVCDSSYLIDKQSYHSPKMVELRAILVERLNVKKNKRKVIIFSEWVTMLDLIGGMLNQEGITYTKLTGKVPASKRHSLIKEFEENDECSVFLSSESGGAGLNLQIADTVINFELPWNPAKKNQRIGRIDRIGQQQQKLHVFNLLSYNSIEIKIATGLLLKQSLFDGVLNEGSLTDEVDFSEKGKSQFIKQLEEVIKDDPHTSAAAIPHEEDPLTEEEPTSLVLNKEEKQMPESVSQPKEGHKEGEEASSENSAEPIIAPNFAQIEHVMTKGMEFLTGLYQMNTGQQLSNSAAPKVNVNQETGEVSISFKVVQDTATV